MTETQWRPKKDAPRDGTPIIIWSIYSTGMMTGGRFGEIEHGGKVLEGWFTFDPLNVDADGWGSMEFDEDDERDFLWIPFPQWELAESLGKALVRAHEDRLKKAAEKPPGEDTEE